MAFSSNVFIFMFFPILFLLYCIIKNNTFRNIILTVASIIFYAFGEPVAVIIMLISIFFNYIFGIIASREKYDKLAVILAVILNIGLLIAYKYTGFIVDIINNITPLSLKPVNIRLPIGISFFTFQGLSYVIDVYRTKKIVQKNLFYLILYISFFPQLIAGPIVRYEDISSQINKREFTIDRIVRGIKRFIFGLGKKMLIANQMGFIADTVFGFAPNELSFMSTWLGAICYTLQIYFDFSGYSDMAIGLGCMFGFDFKENFNYPLIANNVQNFWRRWHISLSTWFKEYVYIPLGGNRKGTFRTVVNRLIIFFLTGLWHGANFTFIVWGLIHGIFLTLETYQIIPTKKTWFKPIGYIYTLLVVILTFVIFRADNLNQAFSMIANMFTFKSGNYLVNAQILSSINLMVIISFVFAIVLSTPIFEFIKNKIKDIKVLEIYNSLSYAGSILIFVLCILSILSSTYNPFIYFRF